MVPVTVTTTGRCSWLNIPRYCWFVTQYSKVFLVRDSIFPGIVGSWLNIPRYCGFMSQYSQALLVCDSYPQVLLLRDSVFPGIAGSWLNIPRYCCSWHDIPRYCGFMSQYSQVLLVRDSYPQVLLVRDSVFPGIAGSWFNIPRYCWFVTQVSFGPPVKQLLFNQCVPTPRKKKKNCCKSAETKCWHSFTLSGIRSKRNCEFSPTPEKATVLAVFLWWLLTENFSPIMITVEPTMRSAWVKPVWLEDQKTKWDLSRFLMIAYTALFSALLSRLTAHTCGSIWVTSFL